MKYISLFLIVVTFLACEKPHDKLAFRAVEEQSEFQPNSVLEAFHLKYEVPRHLDSTGQTLIPISIILANSKHKQKRANIKIYPKFWNVLFYNLSTGEKRLLTQDKIRISRIHSKNDKLPNTEKTMTGKVLYEMGDIDYNKDNKLNYRDPEFLFISETDGTNFKKISPKDEHLQYFKVLKNASIIIIRTLRDVNKDLIFNSKDESILYKIELIDNSWKTEELIGSTERKQMEQLYFDQWLKVR